MSSFSQSANRLNKFEIQEELGRGGFGVVYKALDTVLGRTVAIKVLHPNLVNDPSFLSRFSKEAQIAAQLDHPNLVPVYDFGHEDGRYYIVMGYMSGGSLKDRLAKEGKLSPERALEIIEQVGRGIDYAHRKGIVHRDLKPGNILFDDEGRARVSDMGFAKVLSGGAGISMSISGGVVGTPAYMAPEIWKGQEASPATDVYSLACILSEMVTGEVLFDGDTTPAVMTRHFEPIHIPMDVPEAWRRGLEAGLATDPNRRIQKAPLLLDRIRKQSTEISSASPAIRTPSKKKSPLLLYGALGLMGLLAFFAFFRNLEKPDSSNLNIEPPPSQASISALTTHEVAIPTLPETSTPDPTETNAFLLLLPLLILIVLLVLLSNSAPPTAP